MNVIQHAHPHGVYCPEHGLQFVNREKFDISDASCPTPFCTLKGEFEAILFKAAMIDGCAYCHKAPIVPSDSNKPFWYDEKTGKVYCHESCHKCSRKKCTMKGCVATAKKSVWIILDGTEYIIPSCLCYLHSDKIPSVPNDALWSFVCANYKDVPDRSKCRMELRDIPE